MSRTSTLLSDFQLAEAELASTPDTLASLPADAWLPVEVPGGVHESLLAAGRIPHPYLNDNEGEIRWIEERDWWYRCRFAGPADLREGEALSLRFLGLDTVADIWLNGERLGHHENMFRPAEFAITPQVQDDNELLIRFSPPLAGLELPKSTETWARLSQMMPVSSDIMQLAAQRGRRSSRGAGTSARGSLRSESGAPSSWFVARRRSSRGTTYGPIGSTPMAPRT